MHRPPHHAQERFEVLDAYRGVCAILVALFHVNVFTHLYFLPVVRHGFLFVDFFFVLSGFVITHAYGERLVDFAAAGRFVVRRFGRLWPLHATVLAGFVVLQLMDASVLGADPITHHAAFTGKYSLPALLTNLLLAQGLDLHHSLTWNYPSWSVGVEFYTYLVFALTCCLGRRHTAFMAVFFAAAGLAIVAAYSRTFMDTTASFGFARALYGFFVGHLVYRLYRQRRDHRQPAFGRGTVLEAAALGASLLFVWVAGRGPLSLAAPLVFAAVVYVFAWESGLPARAMRHPWALRLGRWSFSIYLVHALVLTALQQSLRLCERHFGVHFGATRAVNGHHYAALSFGSLTENDLVVAAFLCIVIALAAHLHEWIERPSRQWFNRRSRIPQAA